MSNPQPQNSSTLRDPHDWKTGGEPITASQKSYLDTLATEAGEQLDGLDSMTKSEAALCIEKFQEKTGRKPT